MRQAQEAEEAERRRAQELSERQNKKERRELKFAHMKERLSDGSAGRRKRTRAGTSLAVHGSLLKADSAELLESLRREGPDGQSVFLMGNPRRSDTASNAAPGAARIIPQMLAESQKHREKDVPMEKRIDSKGTPSKRALKKGDLANNLKDRLSNAIQHKATFDELKLKEESMEKHEKFELPPMVASADQRIENMRRANKLKARADKKAQEEVARKTKFESMPGKEKETIQHAFELYDRLSDGHNQNSLGLDAEGLRNALIELGLRGCCTAEWKAIKQMCEVAAPTKKSESEGSMGERRKVGCDICKFGVDVVPDVRKVLTEYRRSQCQRLLEMCKTGWEDGSIDADEAYQCVLQCWPLAIEGDDGQMDKEVSEGIRRCLQTYNDERDISSLSKDVEQLTEAHQHKCCLLQRHLQKKYDLAEELFVEYRPELISVHSLFMGVDRDMHDRVTSRNMIYIFKELKLLEVHWESPDGGEVKLGEDSWQARAISLINEAAPIGFRRFLELTREISDLQEFFQPKAKERAESLQEAFERHCLDDEFEPEPFIVPEQLPAIFKDTHIEAEHDSERSQMSLSRLQADADIDGSGHLTLDMVRKQCRVASLQLSVQNVLEELDLGKKYGFGFGEVRDMRGVFHQFDEDASGMLEQGEVQEALKLLNLDCPSTRENYFSVAFSMLDEDGSGALDFFEFMHLIQRVRDKEGIFKSEDSPIATLKDLDRMDMLLALDCFDIDARDIDDAACAQRIQQLLEVDASASLMSVLHVQTLAELFSHCRWRHQYLQNSG